MDEEKKQQLYKQLQEAEDTNDIERQIALAKELNELNSKKSRRDTNA
ncbi:hypothetical protein [Salinicoccus roseus]|nr:hypothetical protein [Salinicoccus roseus]